MNIRSHMIVHQGPKAVIYVLVEGAANDCAVYMKEVTLEDLNSGVHMMLVNDVAARGGKVSIRDIDALPFKIPSDLVYRA